MRFRAKRLDGSPVTIFVKDVTTPGTIALSTKFTVGRRVEVLHVDRAIVDRIPNYQAEKQKYLLREMGIDPDSLPFRTELRAL